ncbi:MAG: PilZ domain-containing protein [bacterium]
MLNDPVLKLVRNTPIVVQPRGSDTNARHAGILVGNIGNKYIVFCGFADAEFQVGDELIVRMVLESEAIGFATQIEEVAEKPARIYFGKFPQSVQSLYLRKAARLSVFFPADVRAAVGEAGEDIQLLKSMVLDIGGGGCRFNAQQSIVPKSEVKISFCFPGEKYIHLLLGQILQSNPKNGMIAHRLRFSEGNENIAAIGEVSRWVQANYKYAAL